MYNQIAPHIDSIDPFLNILDPSGQLIHSPIYKEFEDYVYYTHLQIQGEDSKEEREVTSQIPLGRIVSICQAMGYYASNQEIEDMVNEVKFTRFAKGDGEEVETVSFHDLIRLFINHKPYGDVNMDDLEICLSHAKCLEPGLPPPVLPITRIPPNAPVRMAGTSLLIKESWRFCSTLASQCRTARPNTRLRSWRPHTRTVFLPNSRQRSLWGSCLGFGTVHMLVLHKSGRLFHVLFGFLLGFWT